MLRNFITGLFFFLLCGLHAQTPSGVLYPIAECNGGTCPAYTSVKSHITSGLIDTLTETFYVAGQFRTLGGQTRIGLGSMNAATGALSSFAPVMDTSGCIYAMSIKGDTLFVGGRFSSINGTPRTNFAAIRISNGQLLPTFNQGIGNTSDTVFSITVYNGRIYVGGKFNTVFSIARTNIARLNYSGTVDSWNPPGMGIVTRTMQWRNQLLATARATALEERLVRIDTSSATVFQVMSTTGSFSSFCQNIQDFAVRNDSVYATGNFFEIDGTGYDGFVAANITTGVERPWGIAIPYFAQHPKLKVRIEYYRDSLYLSVFDASTQVPPTHSLYAVHYRGATLRTMKIYNSNDPGLNGYYGQDIFIGNARLMEIERFAQHTSFPNGSVRCHIYSWCMKIPVLCGNWIGNPYSACPNDTTWVSVSHQNYYASYVWSVGFGNMTLTPNGDSCMIVTAGNFTGGQITVRGSTSCGVLNSSARTILIGLLTPPAVSAGPDDTLSCFITSLTLHGTCVPSPLSWSWSGPNATSNADSVVVNMPGMFYLTCAGTNGCRRTDSAYVFADTIPPAIVPFGSVPQLTCAQTTVTLDASSIYPGDSLRWLIGAGSYPNPAYATVPATVYLTVTDRNNGCQAMDSVTVTQNTTPPNASIIASDTLLTCTEDTIVLTGNSSTTGVFFHWEDTSSNQFADPLIVDSVGVYALFATSSMNGCVTGPIVQFINGWYTPPNIIVATDSFNTNCSYNTVQLIASSLTTSAVLSWTDSVSFDAPNPATTNQQGMYYVNATDTLNGCSAVDSAYVGYVPVLDVIGVSDTIICPGSGAVLNVSPVGGTSPFSFVWNNSAGNNALVTVYPADTLQYIVTVNDGGGCTGYDTVAVNVPDDLMDSTLTFQPCDPQQPTGQVQVYPWGGVPPYQFSIDNGMTWQTSGVFTGLTYGLYQFIIQDAIGCTRSTSAIIDTNSLSPTPEFLVSTSPELGDTIVIVDISNPRPDSVTWDFPVGTVVVDSAMFAPEIIPADTGAFTISMHAWYGTCEVVLTRNISVVPFDSASAQPWGMNQVDSLVLYPNPNNGVFTVYTHLQGKQDFVIIVTDELGVERSRVQVSDSDEWTGQMNVPGAVPGNYVLRVIAEYDSAAIVFVVAQ